ncbi:LuxR C-terminal-related transcriptional regulator [Paludisphaera rhizosphaerae]|uniref:LuxR C-terminal-related transcriptional regulator n=1 Tax=Paludisphaera rhizosphaerae TaxID=2711216 RepID=UPI001F10B1ED|nr:LuxR C-terminal-related transcriptional regulator [Paludisphaera rhizosphaerae]
MHRSYKPAVEGIEARRLLSGATLAATLSVPTTDHQTLLDSASSPSIYPDSPVSSGNAWDAALLDARLDDFFSSLGTATEEPQVVSTLDQEAMASGLNQLDRYLTSSWKRAGVSPQSYEDSSQAVYITLLQQLGRSRFDAMLSDVGRWGIKEVFSKETDEGQDFFRAVDMVKKRVQRERTYQPLDDAAFAAADLETQSRLDALREVMDRTLTPREASLIQESLKGLTPSEIALQWGVAPKTVSNEKTRVLNKLRDVLQGQLAD